MFKILLPLFLFTQFALAGEMFHVSSGSNQLNLLELYSSEGCSSCPPKEAWFTTLRNKDGLWTKFVPIEFHVDYWNYLGWKDRFSKSEFTDRQKGYAAEWKNQRIYTPGLILNGSEWRPDSSDETFLKATGNEVGSLDVSEKSSGTFLVTFNPKIKNADWHVYGALLANGLKSDVKSGENEGKELRHEFVAVSFNDQKLKFQRSTYSVELSLTRPLNISPSTYSAVFWVSREGSLKPIQVVGGDIKITNLMGGSMKKYEKPSEEKIKDMLSPEEFAVTQKAGTERPFANKYWDNHEKGIYVDVVTGEPLFSSRDKFDSGTGWPSFTKPIEDTNIKKKADRSLFSGTRTEVRSKNGDSHLGHVFNDGPPEKGGERFCINSAALKFVPLSKLKESGYEEYLALFKSERK